MNKIKNGRLNTDLQIEGGKSVFPSLKIITTISLPK